MKFLVPVLAFSLLASTALAQDAIRPAPPTPPIAAARDVAYPGVIQLRIDATDTDRRIFSVRETIPVAGPGPLTLLYPQWLPGNHAPRGPIDRLAGLTITADGRPLAWRRHPVEVYAVEVDVPSGARALEVSFQQLTPTDTDQGRVQITGEMLNLQWEKALLYPAGHYASRITVQPSVTLPAGWRFGAALEPASTRGGTTTFEPVSLETLVDSPMFAGAHYAQVDLDPGGKAAGRPPVRLNIVADAPENLAVAPAQLEQHRALVKQADALFGSRHFDRYDFLLATTERMGGIGLEHHRSSENGVGPEYFTDWSKAPARHDLLPHEYVHSWNGKHRRGADLWTPTYNTPMRDSLLWVYEGQTQFWGWVLAARSGLLTREQSLEALAIVAAVYDNRPGRSWRPLADTTFGPILSARRPQPWTDWQRGEDYYQEGQLVWLDADQLIRERSNGARSLDDFAKAFFGGPGGRATVSTYTFEDVVAALNAVEPYDWAAFLRERVDAFGTKAPLGGVTRGGYRLVYRETPSSLTKADEAARKVTDLSWSLGMVLNSEGKVSGVRWEGPAYKAGMTTGGMVTAVNGAAYTADKLKAAVTAAKAGAPLELLVKAGDRYRTYKLEHRGGLRYPHLERVGTGPARLDALLTAR